MNVKKADFLGEEPTYKKGGIIMFDKMKLKMKKVMKNEKGMTLIELLAVIVIIAIIALIAVPAIGNIINNSKDKAILSDASTIISGAKLAIADGACNGSSKTTGEGDGATTTPTCNKDALKDFIEKDELQGNGVDYTVTKAGSVYTLYFTEFDNLSTKGKSKYPITNKTITSSKLAEYMGNK